MYHNLFDSHVHSDNSFDAHHSVTFLCENAVERGIKGLCITDHCEMREYGQEEYARRIEQSAFDAQRAARVFNGRLLVMAGIELSDVLFDQALTAQVIASQHFDMILVSQHNTVEGEDVYYADFTQWSSKDIDDYLRSYFAYLVRIAKWDGYDVLAHLTYPLRYISGKHKISVDLHRYDDYLEELLKIAAQNGRGVEINTAGLFQEIKETAPPFYLIKRFRELGGEYITIGSDAHSAESLGKGVVSEMQEMHEAGFTHLTFYKQRQPLLFSIEDDVKIMKE